MQRMDHNELSNLPACSVQRVRLNLSYEAHREAMCTVRNEMQDHFTGTPEPFIIIEGITPGPINLPLICFDETGLGYFGKHRLEIFENPNYEVAP